MLELKVDGFSGPLDLLLDLIEREKLDITELSLAQVADQYWEHVESQEDLEPDALSEFILIGSKLLYDETGPFSMEIVSSIFNIVFSTPSSYRNTFLLPC